MVVPAHGLASETFGDGPQVVLVHGFTQTGRSWAQVAADLGRDHRVTTVDAPGHGDSSELACGLAEAADRLGRTGGRATYLGYSMGGRIALHLALQHPYLVDRLILLGATGGLDTEAERAQRRAADDRLAADLERDGVDAFLDRWLANPMFAGLPDDPAALADRRRNTVGGLASSLRLAGTGSQEPLWGRLPALEMPVLVLAGEHDAKFRALGERLADTIGTNARFEVIAGAGHAAHLARPAAFLRSVRRFLDEP